MPAYRDDHEALLQRAESLERELADARDEAAALREENQALREGAPAPPVSALARRDRLDQAAFIGTLAVWAVVAAFVGGAAWMLPAAFITSLAVGIAMRRRPQRPRARR